MRQFSFTDVNRQPGEVLDAAMDQPVLLTRRGKEKLVIVRAELFRSLIERTPSPDQVEKSMTVSDATAREMLRIMGRD